MTVFSKRSHEGYLMIDHRASPGIPEGAARRMGLDPAQVGEGRMMETSTLGCPHCGSVVVLNPQRTRERAHCYKCNRYICDGCAAVMHRGGYVHRTIMQIAEMVKSGRYVITGGSMSDLQTKEVSHG